MREREEKITKYFAPKKLLEIVLPADKELMEDSMIDMNGLAASGRILWGMAFALAILKTIKVWKLINFKRMLDSLYDLHIV